MEEEYDYNKEPVFYCRRCLSLRVRDVPGMDDSEYCEDCGSTDIESCHIDDWKRKYKDRYGTAYL